MPRKTFHLPSVLMATSVVISLASLSAAAAEQKGQAMKPQASAHTMQKGGAAARPAAASHSTTTGARETMRRSSTRVSSRETTVHGGQGRGGGHYVWRGGRQVWVAIGDAGYASPGVSVTTYGGGHSCGWYLRYDRADLPAACAGSYSVGYGYAAPSGGYAYTTGGGYRYGVRRSASVRTTTSRSESVTQTRSANRERSATTMQRQSAGSRMEHAGHMEHAGAGAKPHAAGGGAEKARTEKRS